MAASVHKNRSAVPAFTLAEMLVALAIMGLILTAIATAFHASAVNYRENASIAEAMNSARNALTTMTTLIRTGQPNPSAEAVGTLSLVTAENHHVVFRHDNAQRTIYYSNNTMGIANRKLSENVTSLVFTKTLTPSGDVKSVVISMTVQVNNITETFTAAAVVRRNLP
ncbi:MAG TPA: type II secretion system protein [Sedimentisphaerales bacterium]|nr:type II secretion system protein [Sedimentisphaerales bacterium]